MLSGEIFREKLQSIMQLREQIEDLAARHKSEEDALNGVLNSMVFTDASHQQKTQQELIETLTERDRTIEMLDMFKREGNAIISRMHENLKRATEQHEAAVARIEEMTLERKRRDAEVDEMLNEADRIIVDLRQQNEGLRAELVARGPGDADPRSSSASPNGKLSQDVEALQDQLRKERRARLESEEHSQKIISEQQRHIDLLEQRLAQLPRQSTPRSAYAGRKGPSTPTASESAPSRDEPAMATPSEREDAVRYSASVGSTQASPPAANTADSSAHAEPPAVHTDTRAASPADKSATKPPSRSAVALDSSGSLSDDDGADALGGLDEDSDGADEGAANMKELEELDRQLKQTMQSLSAVAPP